MSVLGNPFVVFGAFSSALTLGIAAIVWHQRQSHGARAYAILMVSVSVFCGLYTMQLVEPTVERKRMWLTAYHALTPVIGVLFWVFSARYIDKPDLLEWRRLGPILASGGALMWVVVANPGGLYLSDVVLVTSNDMRLLHTDYGPLYWVMQAYIALVVGGAHVFTSQKYRDSFGVYRKQLFADTVVGLFVLGTWLLYLTEFLPLVPTLNPWPHVVLPVYAVIFAVLPFGWSYLKVGMFVLQPLAQQTVIEDMRDAVFVTDRQHVLRYVNAEAKRLLRDASIEHAEGTPVQEAFDDWPDLLDRYEAGPDTTREDTEPIELSVDDGTRYYDVRISPIRNSANRHTGTAIVARDVTTRLEREHELAETNEQLERKNEQLERLADVISHDMRTPLSTAEKTLQLLRADLSDPDPEVERSLEDLERTTQRLWEFADHLPRLARESTDVESPTECDLEELAREAWEVVDTGDVHLRIEDTTTLECDTPRLLQVLENLFDNAVAHGQTTRSEARVSAVDLDADGGTPEAATVSVVRVGCFDGGFYVADDGPGIPPEMREDVFEYGTSTGDGSGIGLSVVRNIVEAHGWTVTVTESDGGGARFEIRT